MIAAPANYGPGHTRWADAYFTKPDGTRYVAGDVLKNPAYAETVATLARDGPKPSTKARSPKPSLRRRTKTRDPVP